MKKLMVILICVLIKAGLAEDWSSKSLVNLQYPCTLFIYPDTVQGLQIGDTFTIGVNVANAYQLNTYQVYIRWNGPDTSVLKIVQIEKGPFLSQGGSTGFITKKYDTRLFPYISVYEYLLGQVGVSGSGTLFYMDFQIKDTIATPLSIFVDKLIDQWQSIQDHERIDAFLKYQIPSQNLPDTVWTRRYHKYDYYNQDRVLKIEKSSDGFYLLGDGEAWYSDNRGVLFKYSFSGNLIWNISVGWSPSDMLVGGNGDVYLLGTTWEEYPTAKYNIRLEKYSSMGNLIWSRSYGTNNVHEIAKKFVEDNSGNLIIGGYKGNYLILKYSSDGVLIWNKEYNIDDSDYPVALAVDSVGDIYLAGYSQPSSGYNSDYVIMKLSSSTGDTLWVRSFNGEADSTDIPVGIVIDEGGNPYVTGKSYGISCGYDILTIKYSSITGDTIWTRRYNGLANGDDIATGITIDSLQNIYIIGNTKNTTTQQDWILLKYSFNGDLIWQREYNGWSYDSPTCIKLDSNGKIYVGGGSYGGKTGYDFYVETYSANGEPLWNSRFNDVSNGYDCISTTFANGDTLYVAGTSYGNAYTGMDFLIIKYLVTTPGIEEAQSRKLKSNSQNPQLEIYPNPFGKKTVIRYLIPDTGYWKCEGEQNVRESVGSISGYQQSAIRIFDVAGRLVRNLPIRQATNSLINQITWDSKDELGRLVPQGIYLVQLTTKSSSIVRKIIKIE